MIVVAGVVTASMLVPAAARAQRAICAPISPAELVHTTCKPYSLFLAVRFLADFSVDHLFKPTPPPVRRTIVDFVQAFAGDALTTNPALQKFLAALPPLRFSQLDRSTGSVLTDFGDATLEFEERLEFPEGTPTVRLRIPRHLQGGYWRGPDVLQIAFWEAHRVSFRVAPTQGQAVEGELDCMSISPEAVVFRFSPATLPPLVIRLSDCGS